ncbi:hypothetical protein XccvBFoX7_gp67c [Xanthomonas phage FoX7]|uniref:Uncharacterized protein n=1 Tax=Xanthomonas phage FoX7 TaxID=2723903 RepID=A0A858NRL8_9CAUD|nr:hypothetical protein XccvBFoX7_gp67c [Xanthomonas phage FoX7]
MKVPDERSLLAQKFGIIATTVAFDSKIRYYSYIN